MVQGVQIFTFIGVFLAVPEKTKWYSVSMRTAEFFCSDILTFGVSSSASAPAKQANAR